MLVDHALSRFSTDNLSCMLVRFDSRRVQETVDQKAEPIGVEGDPASQRGSMSEADVLVQQQKAKLVASGQLMDRMPDDITEEVDEGQEPGPELSLAAVEAARKDRMPEPPKEALEAEANNE